MCCIGVRICKFILCTCAPRGVNLTAGYAQHEVKLRQWTVADLVAPLSMMIGLGWFLKALDINLSQLLEWLLM